MLRMEAKTGAKDAKDAKEYFLKELDHEGDYFLESIDEPGYYGGKATVLLGLEPGKTVDKDSFFALIDNLHPPDRGTTYAPYEGRPPHLGGDELLSTQGGILAGPNPR